MVIEFVESDKPRDLVAKLTGEQIAEIEARARAASSGPWIVTDGQHIDQYGHHPDGNRLLSEGSYDANYHMFGPNDAEFIAHSRQDVPALCSDWRLLKSELQQERSDADRLRAALEAIVNIAGNLSDERVEAVGGVNDARSRALMVICARQIAQNALAKGEEK